MTAKKYYVNGGNSVNVCLKDSLLRIDESYETDDPEEQEALDQYLKNKVLSLSSKNTTAATPVSDTVKTKK